MKFKVVIFACSALLLSGCMSTSGTYRQNVAYEGDGYYDSADAYPSDGGYYDDGYYDNDYYDSGYYDNGYYEGGFYGGISFGSGFGDPFWYGGGYGYCSPRYAFCPGSPLFYGGGYGYGYGGGYGYGWPYWGFHQGDRDDDHHHHHHHRDNPPDPVVVNPPPVNLPGTNGQPGRVFLTPHPRKGVFRPNVSTEPQPMVDADGNDGDRTPRTRPNDGSGNVPPMRWRNPPATRPMPPDRMTQDDTLSGSIQDRRPQLASDRPPARSAEPPPPNRAVDRVQIALPSRSDSTPEPPTSDTSSRNNDNDSPLRNHRRGDAGGGH